MLHNVFSLSAGGCSSSEALDASSSSPSTIAVEIKSSLVPSSSSAVGGGVRRKQRGSVRFAEEVPNEDDGSGNDLAMLREMSVGPSSNLATSSLSHSQRGSRAHSLRPEMVSSASSYKPSFGSSPFSSSTSSYRSFPAGVGDKVRASYKTFKHAIYLQSWSFMWLFFQLSGYDVQDVKGDGGCYYRCLSLFFTGSESNYMKYRREVLEYIRENLDNYSTMIRSELSGSARSTSDYFQRKTRADRQVRKLAIWV